MVTICLDFIWTLRIGQNEFSLHESQLLCGLNSVENVVRVLSLLNGSKFCAGNSDEFFQIN